MVPTALAGDATARTRSTSNLPLAKGAGKRWSTHQAINGPRSCNVRFGSKADTTATRRRVRYVPLPDISALANFVIYAGACPICWSGFFLSVKAKSAPVVLRAC